MSIVIVIAIVIVIDITMGIAGFELNAYLREAVARG